MHIAEQPPTFSLMGDMQPQHQSQNSLFIKPLSKGILFFSKEEKQKIKLLLELVNSLFVTKGMLYITEKEDIKQFKRYKIEVRAETATIHRIKDLLSLTFTCSLTYAHICTLEANISQNIFFEPLENIIPKVEKNVKIVVFSPQSASRAIIKEISKVSEVGHTIFSSVGIARYLPQEGSRPAIGCVGSLEEVEEVRIESTVPLSNLPTVVEAIKRVHPYEEVGYDVIPWILNLNYLWLKYPLHQIQNQSNVSFSPNVKLRIAIEQDKAEHLRTLIGQNGAGTIGKYSFCSFSQQSVMHYISEEVHDFYTKTKSEFVETITPRNTIENLISALSKQKDLSDVGIDAYPLLHFTPLKV